MEIIKDLTKYNKSDSSYRKPIDRIIIHWFGIGTLTSALNRFKSPTGDASAHYLVSNGKIYQCVLEEEVAWHAGNWEMNQRSIGIEHDATASTDAHPHDLSELDYKTSAELIADICKRHNIPLDREHILGHREVSSTSCPGTVDIDKLISLAKGENMGFNLDEDMSSEVEEKYKLKDYAWYSKYWTFDEFIKDSVSTHDKLYNLQDAYKDLEKKITTLEGTIKLQADEIKSKIEQIDTLQKTVTTLGDQMKTLSATIKSYQEDSKLIDEIYEEAK